MEKEKENCCCCDPEGKATVIIEKTGRGVKVEISPCCSQEDKEEHGENSCSYDKKKNSPCC